MWRVGGWSLSGAALLWGGCGPRCDTDGWPELVELDGTATQAQILEVDQAIAYFREWTGRDTVCVETIGLGQLEPPGEETAWGWYLPRQGRIEISTMQGEEGGHLYTAIHEMCHAVDFMEDISLSSAEAFPPIEDPEKHYRNKKARIQEKFGRVCGVGLAYTDLRWVVDEECGDEDYFGLTEGHRIVSEQVYTEVNQQRLSDERLTVDVADTVRIEPPVGRLADSATVDGYLVQLIIQELQRVGASGPIEVAVELHLRDLQTGQLAHRFTIEDAARTIDGELLGHWTIPEGEVISVIQEGEESTVWVADVGLNVLEPYTLETPEAALSSTKAVFVNSTLAYTSGGSQPWLSFFDVNAGVFQHLPLEVGGEPVSVEGVHTLGGELLIAAGDWLGVGGWSESGWSVVWQEVDWNLYEIYGVGGDWVLAVVAVGPIEYGTLVNHVFWNRRLNTWHVSEPICTLGARQSTTNGTIYSHRSEDGWHEVTTWMLER